MLRRHVILLLIQTAFSLAVCAGLVAICYRFVDRPVAIWAVYHTVWIYQWLKWSDFILVLMIAAPIALILICIKRFWGPWRRWEALVVAIVCSVLAMTALKQLLKWVFGRPSTKTWIESGGLTLDGGDYSLRWFQGFYPYDAFPSGHIAVACTIASIVWLLWPKWRLLAVAAVIAIAVCLIITDAHFVSDVIAGGFIGWLGGLWSVQFMPSAILPADTTRALRQASAKR